MTVTTPDSFVDDSLAKRNALLLALAQAIGGASASIVIATAPLVGYSMLDTDKSLATLPVSAMVLGTAFGTIPAGMIMRRYGRRTGFMGAALLGAIAGLLAAFAVFQDEFLMFALGCCISGFAGAFVQQYRFAAADTASDAFKPKAISWVLAGGVLAGVVGPQTVIATKDLFSPILFAGTYLAQAGLSLIAFFLVAFLRIPKPQRHSHAQAGGRPLRQIMSQRRFIVAAACGICSYALMSMVMTATPLAMIGCGLSQNDATLGIQWHVLAMFGPSFFTGNLIGRFGKERIVSIGLLLLAGCSVVALMGVDLANFWIALILLGLGWNFGFIGATAMLTDTYRPEERNLVQAVNDFLVFGFVAAASFSSGALLNVYGWNTVTLLVFPFVVLCIGLLIWLAVAERRADTTA
ncbi:MULTISPECIES: MFS transporter [Stappiaceae]|uniref:MFS transporter, aromatic acid:H+ symporter (AAHS) family n=1 Tax=Roseibium aggregatum TaxID=187304 RepID=A0A0M6XUW2_9HYPH|nr:MULTISPECIES: MFS transporter [Stappiaceae]MBO9458431.1 MFS transporter [Labrenzia sp. R5_0]UES45358.1 MFS transporter [Roseibium aggregatum]CTQ41624.1 MFS transporter, aromatic acid:H+ symporter (AAHS) family [Roseibium aggregatum]